MQTRAETYGCTEYEGGTVSFVDAGRVRIAVRSWRASSAARSLVCLHGIGGRSQEFVPLGEHLSARGTAVYAPDFPGCGGSQGKRGVITLSAYRATVTAALGQARSSHPGAPLFFLGHSLGALIALSYAAGMPAGLRGLILAAPPVAPGRSPGLRTILKIVSRGVLAPGSQVFLDLEAGQVDTPAALYHRTDPQHVRAWTPLSYLPLARWYWGAARAARRIGLPALILQGDGDLLARPAGSLRLCDWLRTTDKQLVRFPQAGHSLYDAIGPIDSHEHSPELRARVLETIARWLEAH